MGDAFSVPFILSWVDSLIMLMTKNGLSFRHCGVFANLADENSPIIVAFFTLVLFHQFELFCLRAYFIESKTTKDDKTICFNPIGRPRVVYDPYRTIYTLLPGPI